MADHLSYIGLFAEGVHFMAEIVCMSGTRS